MAITLTSGQVWDALALELFAVLGMVNRRQEARTVGVVYVVEGRKLYVGTGKDTWKVKHLQHNPSVSVTVPIAKRVPLMPWIKVPAATITFSGSAAVLEAEDVPDALWKRVFRTEAQDPATISDMVLLEIVPEGEFLTYGVGVSLLQMRNPDQARGRAPV